MNGTKYFIFTDGDYGALFEGHHHIMNGDTFEIEEAITAREATRIDVEFFDDEEPPTSFDANLARQVL